MIVRAQHSATHPDVPLFVSSSDGMMSTRTVHWLFQRLRSELRWIARGAYTQPRIHDLRYTFICRRVLLWHEHGTDIDNAMAALSTYVGHAKVSDTYWYLTGFPGLMAVAGKRFEQFAATAGGNHHG